jgi:hypothetical protein
MAKRIIPKALFEPLDGIQASDLMEHDDLINMIKKEVPMAIEEAHKNKKTFATLFEINGLGLFLDIPKQYWVPALEQCINYKLEEEKFEDCITLKNLIDTIKKSTTKKTNKRKDNGASANGDTVSN